MGLLLLSASSISLLVREDTDSCLQTGQCTGNRMNTSVTALSSRNTALPHSQGGADQGSRGDRRSRRVKVCLRQIDFGCNGDVSGNCRDMAAPRGGGLCLKLHGGLPRSIRCTACATLHKAPLAR